MLSYSTSKYKFLGQENITSILLIKSSGNDFIVKDSILLKVNWLVIPKVLRIMNSQEKRTIERSLVARYRPWCRTFD